MMEPLAFAQELLLGEDSLVESSGGVIEAILPKSLSERMKLPEHVLLSESEASGALCIGYGTEILDRFIAATTSRMPIVWTKLEGVSCSPEVALKRAAAWTLRNGVFSVGTSRACTGRRLWLHAAYTLRADERREGLVSAAVCLKSGVWVEGFEEAAVGKLEPVPPSASSREEAAKAVHAALGVCELLARHQGTSFMDSMERRLERDRERLLGYFADLDREMKKRASRGRLSPADVEAKRQALSADRESKLAALASRYAFKVDAHPVGAAVVEAPVVLIELRLRRRKAEKSIEVEYDGATRRIIPVACDGCGGDAQRPAACDDAMHLLCEICAPRSEGRIHCIVCLGREKYEKLA